MRKGKPITAGVKYPGGIFGAPAAPRGRSGIFITHWDLPEDDAAADEGVLDPKTYKKIKGSSFNEGGDVFLRPGERVRFIRSSGVLGADSVDIPGMVPSAPPAVAPGRPAPETLAELYARTERNSWIRLGIMVALTLLFLPGKSPERQ